MRLSLKSFLLNVHWYTLRSLFLHYSFIFRVSSLVKITSKVDKRSIKTNNKLDKLTLTCTINFVRSQRIMLIQIGRLNFKLLNCWLVISQQKNLNITIISNNKGNKYFLNVIKLNAQNQKEDIKKSPLEKMRQNTKLLKEQHEKSTIKIALLIECRFTRCLKITEFRGNLRQENGQILIEMRALSMLPLTIALSD